jgi:pilus assembly protein CpaE
VSKPSVVVFGAPAYVEQRLRGMLADVAAIGLCEPDLERAGRRLHEVGAGVALVVLNGQPQQSLGLVTALAGAGTKPIVLGAAKDPELILGAMRAGAREYVVLSDEAELQAAVRKLAGDGERAGSGVVTSIFPTKGGAGATTIATNLAGALARRQARVCLLDLNLFLGDALSFLDLAGTYTIIDAVSNLGRFDRELLDSSVVRHGSGVVVLAQSDRPEDADRLRGADVAALLAFLRQHFDHIVIDGLRGFDELALAALDASDHILLALTQDVPAVRNAQRCLGVFQRLRYDGAKLRVVVNRFQRAAKITADVITETLGVPVAATLENDFPSLIRAINRGALMCDVAPRSPLTRDLEQLTGLVGGAPAAPPARGGFFRGIFERSAADAPR